MRVSALLKVNDSFEDTTEIARGLRRSSTLPERLLWDHLRGRRFHGLKFRRQHAVGPYVLDFYCAELKLGIELDGPNHTGAEQAARDLVRTRYLEARGLHLLRFTNRMLIDETIAVLERIMAEGSCASTLTLPSPSKGEGEVGGP